ncbi:MAG: tRNA lysidine(34) synthetase TilS [Propionibacteriaceae bacterium]|nr:tRNA lysidine(34) synthetase TilS [Propionibacteriaceae bacterium]
MARRALGPAALAVVQAVERVATGPLLVACSGGADSLALAAAAAIVGRRRELPVRAIVVDHGLQPGSGEVAARVVRQLAPMDVSVIAVRVETTGEGLEAAARTARYNALETATSPDELILLGHTLDDQAETVLLGLARGSGVRSLAGIPARRGRFVRPLLGLRRQVTRAACAELSLDPWEDPHNDAPGFARARVRHRVLPVLEEELGPGVTEALARTAELARADADLLDDLAARLRARDSPDGLLPPPPPEQLPSHLDVRWLAALPAALRSRAVRLWLAEAGGRDLSAAHVRAVLALVTDWRGQGPLDLPGVRVVRRDGALRTAASVPLSPGEPEEPER